MRYRYTSARHPPLTTSSKMFQGLLPTYRALVGVTLGRRDATSIWWDNWTPARPLTAAFPVLYSHCTAPAVLVAGAFSTGALMLPLQDRLSAAASAELHDLTSRFVDLCLGNALDSRHLLWGANVPSAPV